MIDTENKIRVATNDSGVFYNIPGDSSPISLFGHFGVLEIRGVATCDWDLAWNDESLAESFNQCLNPDVIESVRHVGENRYRTFSRIPVAKSNVGGFRYSVDWDVVSCVPVLYARYPGYTDKIQKAHTSGHVEWLERDSLMLPQRLREKTRELMRLRSGQGFSQDVEHELDFHWFSINKDLPQEMFDRDIVEQPGYAAKILSEYDFEQKQATPK